MEAIPPSGRQLELVHAGSSVTVVEVGGGPRDYRVDGVPVLDGYPLDAMASHGRGQLLAPWPNRIAGGRYRWGGATLQLPVSEPATGNAIHGLARWSAWDLERTGSASATASFTVHAQTGYPFTLDFRAEYALGDEGLAVTMTATNRSASAAPVGMGAHPYLFVPGPGGAPLPVDDATLTIPANRRLLVNEALIPIDAEEVAGGPFDFRAARPVGRLALDTCFADLRRDADGLARVVLAGESGEAGGGGTVIVWMDQAWEYIQIFTSDSLRGDERRRSIAVEPQTCPADAFNSGQGLRILEPGESFGGSWGIQPAR
ncbi:aldose 1-epimerase family protein [Frankia sp. CNm7]|uniref:Aldose 1-epimerase family protein n=1 Tax=Frankia nepalensis TaxID=1836974 RepID=A0A937RN34_9ACTN|nr:aldose 1-epimerase family protein [Frankia nepalensis]MBL7502255.1 aldose 1-epimerase family protein [Frankia nepalensis]MBL7516410.1 aldose 1-epimerase family protein [Frankia nepalensis]MBL7521376.1 aldose 1-epimerase family protein [Frankia nepalensis]MBL7631819.1 aldose 1-epimerase family protein [Frankia nepalensis]